MSASREVQGRFIAAIVKDDTGDRWRDCRELPPEVFEDFEIREVWRDIVGAADYEAAALAGAKFFSDPTIGESYLLDRRAILAEYYSRKGAPALALLEKIESNVRSKGPVAWDAFAANPPQDPEVLIEDVLNRCRTMLLCGPSKARKTYTFLYLLLCVANGLDWLGFKVRKGRAMYINLELADFELYRRLHRIAAALGIKPGPDVLLWNLRGKSIDALTIAQEIRARCAGMSLVIVDPWYRINARSGAEENSNDQQASLLMELEAAAHAAGAALVIGHHFAKGDAAAKNFIDRASGAGVFARLPDVFMSLSEHAESDAMTVNLALREFPPVDEFVIRCEHPIWARDDRLNPKDLKSRSGPKVKHTESDAFEKLGTELLTYSQWKSATNLSDTTFRRKRDALIDAGKVEQIGILYRRKAA